MSSIAGAAWKPRFEHEHCPDSPGECQGIAGGGPHLVAFVAAGAVIARASVDPGLKDVRLLGTLQAADVLCSAVTGTRAEKQREERP
jgi:hypothetical protein